MASNYVDAITKVIKGLNESQLAYMVVGSVASIIYGEPRMTKDLDLVIDVRAGDLKHFIEMFSEEDFYLPPAEILMDELARRGMFNLIHHDSGMKVDFVFSKNTAHALIELARRTQVELLPGLVAWVASPEDIIIKKLDFYREGESEKHLGDIRGILMVTPIDREYLDHWVRELRLDREWKLI